MNFITLFWIIVFADLNEDECFIYFTDALISFGPDEDDVLYKGYAKIYDIESRKMTDILLEEPGDVFLCGTTLCRKAAWDTFDLYLEDGTAYPGVESLYICGDKLVQTDYNGCTVYDCNFNKLNYVKNASPLQEGDGYSSEYLRIVSEDYLYGIVEMNGREVLPAIYKRLGTAWGDYFVVGDDSDKYGLVFADGTECFPCEYSTIYADGYFPIMRMSENDINYIFVPGTGIINVDEFLCSSEVYARYPNEGDYSTQELLIYASGETITFPKVRLLGNALTYSEDGLIEFLHGETLLDSSYTSVVCTGEYVYALKDGIWTVFKLELHI